MGSWRDNLRLVKPYVPGEQPDAGDVIKLNTNENPYPPSPKAADVLRDFNAGGLRRYPVIDSVPLADAIAKRYGLDRGQVFTGAGSDEVLAVAFMAFFNGKKPILFPDITYSFYDVWARLFEIPYETLALDAGLNILKKDYCRENGGIVIANPNAPTGIAKDEAFFRDIMKSCGESVVIIDEAYVDFGAKSMLPLINEYDNLLIVQTFSKSYSLAGMRIGYAMGSRELIDAMKDVMFSFNSYPLSSVAVALGKAAIEDADYHKKTVDKIVETREWTKGELSRLGFKFTDSKANFIFASHESAGAPFIFEELKKKGIYVRHFDGPRIDDYLRISIGTREEMERLTDELGKIV